MPDNTLWGHITELRNTLINVILVIALGMGLSLFFYKELFTLLTTPLQKVHEQGLQEQKIQQKRISNPGLEDKIYQTSSDLDRITFLSPGAKETAPGHYLIPARGFLEMSHSMNHKETLVILGPIDGMLTSLKISFWVGLVGTSPLWMFFLLKFLTPALHQHEKRLLIPFLILSMLFLITGVLFAFFVTIPLANEYLQLFNESIGINLWTLSSYLDYTIGLLLASALAFEIAVILLFLVHFGILNADLMINKRRHAIVAAFVLGAILTPPDVLTQLLLAIPLIGLYEVAIFYAKYRRALLLHTNMH